MKYFSSAIILVLIAWFFPVIIRSSRKAEESMADDSFIVRQPKPFFWIGMISFLFAAALTVLFTIFKNDTVDVWVYIIFILFSLLGALFAYYCSRWRICVSDDKLIFSSVFVKEREIDLLSITKVVEKVQKMTIYVDSKKCITVENSAVGYGKLKDLLCGEGIHFE